MAHTIVLMQTEGHETRSFTDYESVHEALEGVCSSYEKHLRAQSKEFMPTIKYSIADLFSYIDQMVDLVILVYQRSSETYAPKAKDWIKEKLYIFFREQDAPSIPPPPSI